jgi:hypothetical protein
MTIADLITKLAAADESLGEIAATVDASKDPAESARKIGIAEAHIGDALAVIGDVRNRFSWTRADIDDLNWAERDLRYALRTLGRVRGALPETR